MVAMTADPNIKRTWLEVEWKDKRPEHVLVIETDLELWPSAPGFDSGALDDMIDNAITRQADVNHTIDRVRVVPTLARQRS